jgi:chromatin structure-remodeling complex subunit RSC9
VSGTTRSLHSPACEGVLTCFSAYEIVHVHGKEPPPKEILEDLTPRGGDLLSRTIENYRPTSSRERRNLGEDMESADDSDGEEQKADKEVDTPESGGRATRGLRQAPPQRILFQPDVTSSRQTRHSSGIPSQPQPANHVSGAAAYNASSNPNSSSFSIANYEPRPPMPLSLRPVITPGNNPLAFAEKLKSTRDAGVAKASREQKQLLPGTGYSGSNIYTRALFGLRSGVLSEQSYALHHLVKISYEQGEKYEFRNFPGLAEGLMEKILEVGTLFYNIEWEPTYDEDESKNSINKLDACNGTADILSRIRMLTARNYPDEMETEAFGTRLRLVNEAGLVLRNMVMQEERESNAYALSRLPLINDVICIVLSLPQRPAVVELRHYAMEIAEQITKYLFLEAGHPLYTSLLAQLDSVDRGAILTSLRAISRISMNLEENNRLRGVPTEVVKVIIDWTLIDDEELVNTCLDFLYQFTAVDENVQLIVDQTDVQGLVNHLARLLLYGAKPQEMGTIRRAEQREPATDDIITKLPRDLLQQLLQYQEPERSSHWYVNRIQ